MSQPTLPRRSGTGRWIVMLLVVAAAGGGYAWWRINKEKQAAAAQQAAAAAPKPGVPVTVTTAKSGTYDVRLEGLGTVQAMNTVTVKTRVDGQIEDIYFKEGQTVKKGDLLLRIDQRPFKAALEQAQAKLVQDQANLKNATLDLQRYTTLAKQEFASRQQLDTQQAAVASGTALTQSDQAAIDNAQVQLGYTEIRSPLDGRIGFRQVDAGNIVHAADTQGLLSIVQMDPINTLYTLPEGQLASVEQAFKRGPVTVTATVVGQRVVPTVDGMVSVVNNQVDQASGTIAIKAVFANPDLKLWPGQSVTTQTLVDTLNHVIVIPPDAVQHGPSGLFVWKVDAQNIASVAPISVGDQDSGGAVVTKGLAVGDKFVIAGQLRLKNGVKVEPHEKAPSDQQAQLVKDRVQ